MRWLNAEGRQNMAQIFKGVVSAGAQLQDISLNKFIWFKGDESEYECGESILECMLSAELTSLISLDLSNNQTFFKSTAFCNMTALVIKQ